MAAIIVLTKNIFLILAEMIEIRNFMNIKTILAMLAF